MTELLPPPEREVPVAVHASIRRRVLAGRRPVRRRLFVAASIAALVAAGATAYGVTRTTGDRVDNAVACHDEPTLRSSVTGILDANGHDPIEVCARSMWGDLGRPAPNLIACADAEHGQVDVFPSNDADLCNRLGLGPVPADFRAASRRLAALSDDLYRALGDGCRSHDDAVAIARSVMDRDGFGEWTIQTLQFDDEHPCVGRYSLWREPQRHVIGLTAMNRTNYDAARSSSD